MLQEVKADFGTLIKAGLPKELPPSRTRNPKLSHAPVRDISDLSLDDKHLALRNALRYFDQEHHHILAPEFLDELEQYGRIYMYRFLPGYAMYARPISQYPARSEQAACIMLMIQNNLDPLVAKHPEELITYGGNGAVFQNWAQYHITMQYLSEMTDEQTLVMYSGHPMGLFPSHRNAPRVVVTNGMMIPNYSKKTDWNRYNALGVTQYGQMTAGSYMYIGPQGIVHGTTITLLNAGRKIGIGQDNLAGRTYVTSGLGGMSGAQALAAVITGAVGVIAEVDPNAVNQRLADGYISSDHVYLDINELIDAIYLAVANKEGVALVYQGNIVDLLEALVDQKVHVDLCSDQTSLHNIDDLGYCPVGYSFAEAQELMLLDKVKFSEAIRGTLHRHVRAVNTLTDRGTYFWDYGNAFLKEAGVANADIFGDTASGYRYPSYVEDIMGPMCFDYGFGPFRWVCCSGDIDDLNKTDDIAATVIREMLESAPDDIKGQLMDNLRWIEQARHQIPVVGSKSRILYADADGRIKIAKAFNRAIKEGVIQAGVVLGRDHHDVSGTDSPYRETANIYDGSRFTADMAIQNVIGDAFRGATWVSIHNGGGVGWGEVINGGFGMLLDGSADADRRLESMLHWDVNNGIARRSWARNQEAIDTAKRAMEANDQLKITLPNLTDDELLDQLLAK